MYSVPPIMACGFANVLKHWRETGLAHTLAGEQFHFLLEYLQLKIDQFSHNTRYKGLAYKKCITIQCLWEFYARMDKIRWKQMFCRQSSGSDFRRVVLLDIADASTCR